MKEKNESDTCWSGTDEELYGEESKYTGDLPDPTGDPTSVGGRDISPEKEITQRDIYEYNDFNVPK